MGQDFVDVGHFMVIKGEMSASQDLTIHGRVEGKIELAQHVLTIGPNGRIKAQVLAKVVIVIGNVDGSITAIERTGAIPLSRRSSEERIERTIKGWDRDGDGYVTFEELTVAQPDFTRAAFNRMDRDHNGKIGKEDFAANRLRRPNSETILPGAEPGRDSVLLRVEFIEDLMHGDANGDGSVSFEEAKSRAPNLTRQTFARLDRNKDGVLDNKDRGQLKRRGGQLRQRKTAPSKSNRSAAQRPVRLPQRPPSTPKP